MSDANNTQVGGDHYRSKAVQPWDFIVSNGMGYLDGNVVKYVSRYRDKGGLQDLKKAMHYLEKLIEVEKLKQAIVSSHPVDSGFKPSSGPVRFPTYGTVDWS